MLSSNNQKEQIRKQELKKQRFTIKKLTVGVASVLIGFTFMGLSASANTTETPVVSKPAIVPDSPSGVNFSDTPASSTFVGSGSKAQPATNLKTPAVSSETPVVFKLAIVPNSPSGNFSNTPASSTTTTVPESSADSSAPKPPVIDMTSYYNSMVTIETPDGQATTPQRQQFAVKTNGTVPTEADVANLSFNSISLPSFEGYTPEVSTLTVGLPLATISDENGQLVLNFPKIQADYQDYFYTVTYKKNAAAPITDQAEQEFDVQFPINAGNIQINDQNAYYYKDTYQNTESSDNGRTWTPVSYEATSLSDALQGNDYTNAQTGLRNQNLPKFNGYIPFLSAVMVTGSNNDEATALLNQLTAAIKRNPYEVPAYTLNSPLLVTFRVSYMTETWQQLDVRFSGQPGDNNYYYKTNNKQEIIQDVNGNNWKKVSYGATSLADALQGTYTNAETGYGNQNLPNRSGYTPYLSFVVVANDPTYEAEAAALLNELTAAIKQNPYEIPAYTLTVPLNVTFNVGYKKNSTPVTPVQDTTVSYVFYDETDNKIVAGGSSVTGQPGTTQSVALTIPTGYKLAAGQTLPTRVVMPNADETFTIYLVHEMKTVTPGEPGITPESPAYKDLFHTVTRTIIVNNPVNGQAETTTQTVVFGRTGTYDEVAKKFTSFGGWKVYINNALTNETTGVWAKYDAPEFNGYTPSQAKVNSEDVTAETPDQTVIINYTKTSNGDKGNTPNGGDQGKTNPSDRNNNTNPGNNGNHDNNNNGNGTNGDNNQPVDKGNHNGNGNNNGINNGNQNGNGNNGLNTNATNNGNGENGQNNKQALPQTGNNTENNAAIAGLGLVSLMAMLGLGGLKKKNN